MDIKDQLNQEAIAHRAHTADYPEHAIFPVGEVVDVAKRDSKWPKYLWCTSKAGLARWVPIDYLNVVGDQATFTEEYDARELTVSKGDRLLLKTEADGWYWAKTINGEEGWIPAEVVDIQEE